MCECFTRNVGLLVILYLDGMAPRVMVLCTTQCIFLSNDLMYTMYNSFNAPACSPLYRRSRRKFPRLDLDSTLSLNSQASAHQLYSNRNPSTKIHPVWVLPPSQLSTHRMIVPPGPYSSLRTYHVDMVPRSYSQPQLRIPCPT